MRGQMTGMLLGLLLCASSAQAQWSIHGGIADYDDFGSGARAGVGWAWSEWSTARLEIDAGDDIRRYELSADFELIEHHRNRLIAGVGYEFWELDFDTTDPFTLNPVSFTLEDDFPTVFLRIEHEFSDRLLATAQFKRLDFDRIDADDNMIAVGLEWRLEGSLSFSGGVSHYQGLEDDQNFISLGVRWAF